MYRCPKCGETKPRDQFYGVRKRSGWCKPCTRERSKAYYAANTERQKQKHREWVVQNRESVAAHKAKSAYGISREEFDRLRAEKQCSICGNTERLRIDHCHTSGIVRGVLCDACNKGLGFFGDNPERLMNAARYLKPDIFASTYDISEEPS